MKKFTKNNSGFTLIELVIVVAIIGILATAIISGTNFIDQRAQSVDVGNYNIARNLQAAFEQYAITIGTGTADLNISGTNGTVLAASDANLTKLINAGILKSNFVVPATTFYLNTDSGNIIIQYKLTSTRYRNTICPNTTTATDCWFKVPSSGALK